MIKKLFEVGAHYGYSRSRRNPSIAKFIFGQKNKNDIFDLELTQKQFVNAMDAIEKTAATGKNILFVAGKNEARIIVRNGAEKVDQPFVCGRWIGGTLTNFKEISKRVRLLDTLKTDKEKGNLEKYTKKERLLIDRQIDDLEKMFGGIADMKELPAMLFIVDPKHEDAAVKEAKTLNIPTVALANSDCDISNITYPIPANDATAKSIAFVVDSVVAAIENGKKNIKKDKPAEEKTK